MILQKDKNLALITHLSGFGSYFFPLGSIIIPFVIRETKKEESKFIDNLTKDVVNFNLSYLLYVSILKLTIVPIFMNSFIEDVFIKNHHFYFDSNISSNEIFGLVSFGSLLSLLVIIKFVLIVQAAIKTNKGEHYNYPFTINFIK